MKKLLALVLAAMMLCVTFGALAEYPAVVEGIDFGGAEVQVLDVVNDLLQSGRNRVAALIGHAAEEHVKVADTILHPVGKIAVAHGQLIEVAEHGQVDSVCCFHSSYPSCIIPVMIAENWIYYMLKNTERQALIPWRSTEGRR